VSSEELLGTVAVVGFPNVGKSTLVNRLTGSRQAVVHETPGVTRDRKEFVCEWAGQRFLLVDTGGVDVADPSPMTQQVADQARRAIAEADLVLFVVDTRAGITPGDEELAAILRRSRKPIFLLANKIDDPGARPSASSSTGSGSATRSRSRRSTATAPATCSTRSSRGSRARARAGGEEAIRVAILGRPNVGKSSLLNALLGEERVIVSEQPGTTRDSIDTVLERGDRTFVLVDTAGIRRKRRQRQGIEYYSELRALRRPSGPTSRSSSSTRARDVVEQDWRGGPRRRRHDSTLVVLSKWDVATSDRGRVRSARAGCASAADLALSRTTSADRQPCSTGSRALRQAHGRIPTGELNRFLASCGRPQPPPTEAVNLSTAPRWRRAPALPVLRQRPGLSRATTATGSRTSCAERFGSRASLSDRLRRRA
jgi:GTP-binding protein